MRSGASPRALLGGAGSLQRRLLLAAGVLLGIALVAAGLSIGFILHRFVRGQIDARLDDRILALVSDAGPDGRLAPDRARDAPPFDRPRSGWSWQVRRGDAVLGSGSLDGRVLVLPDRPTGDDETGQPVPAEGTDPWGRPILLRILTVSGPSGAPPTVYAASAPSAALRGPIVEALRTLALCLGVIGLFLFAGVLLQVRLGLRPLRRLQDQLAQVRAGQAARLSAEQPAEIRPLAEEMNALIDRNAANLAHARAQVANLAHGLKTPLATLTMALADRGADPDGGLAQLVANMDRRVRHHLRRARAAAIAGPARERIELATHVVDLRAALARLHADKALAIEIAIPADVTVACDPQDLDEMLGNLIENACRWCRAVVRIEATTERGQVAVTIEDDGPGLAPEAMTAVLGRGQRLDESLPGHGFGLPIALELAELYGGALRLSRSRLGGLCVSLTLPG